MVAGAAKRLPCCTLFIALLLFIHSSAEQDPTSTTPMGMLREELTAVVAVTTGAAAAADEPPRPPLPEAGKGTKEPDLKKNDEQALTPPEVADAISAVIAADKLNTMQQINLDLYRQNLLPAAAAAANDSKDGSKKERLFFVDATSCTAGDSKDHGGSIDEKDDDQIKVHEEDGSPLRIPPPMNNKKKLLILDLNGLLADINQDKHNAHLSHGKSRGKLVFKRPHCDDFLRFCIQHFELGIWSSRLRANVDAVVNILMKDLKHHLLFCWDLSKCTGTGFNTLENKVKPLVLKELKKLWDKEESDGIPWHQGGFSPSNTLLVDDSPYKALRNPPHTAIFPRPYSYKNKDNALGPDGDLRLYLESLSIADDVQCYVREHPFGQPPITETDPDWDFYKRILLLE